MNVIELGTPYICSHLRSTRLYTHILVASEHNVGYMLLAVEVENAEIRYTQHVLYLPSIGQKITFGSTELLIAKKLPDDFGWEVGVGEDRFEDGIMSSKIASDWYATAKKQGWTIQFFDGLGGFSDPAQKLIKLGNAHKDIRETIGHFVYHIGMNQFERSRATVAYLKQMPSSHYAKFTDSQVSRFIERAIVGCEARNKYFEEVGLEAIPVEKEMYQTAPWGGFRSMLHYLRYSNNSHRLVDFIKDMPDNQIVLLA